MKNELYKPKDFARLQTNTIRAILENNIMQAVLEHGEMKYWLSEFISLPYKNKLDKPFLCSYLRSITWDMTISCYPIEPSLNQLSKRLDIVAKEMYKKHKLNLELSV